MKTVSLWIHALFFMSVGVSHFTNPKMFVDIVPKFLPAHELLVYISGVAEIAGGAGLLIPFLRRPAAWGLLALLLAVFPANINMAVNRLPFNGKDVPVWALWLRLPLQFIGMYWIWWAHLKP